MPEQLLQHKIFPYIGSLDTTKHPLLINPLDIVDVNNIIYTTYSTKRLRPGISPLFTTSRKPFGGARCLNSIDYWRGGNQFLIVLQNNRIKIINNDGVVDDITGDLQIDSSETVSFLKIQGLVILFFSSGTKVPYKWTGTGLITPLTDGFIPNATMGRMFLNSLFIDDPSVPGRIYKSVTGDITDFTSIDAQQFDFEINDGDPDGVTAIFPPFNNSLYVTKRFSIYALTPNYDAEGGIFFAQRSIYSEGIGCNSHNAVVSVEGLIFFTSDHGVHILKDSDKVSGIESDFVSAKIQTIYADSINFSRAAFMKAIYDVKTSSYLLLYPSVGEQYCNALFGYSIRAGDWYKWDNYNQSTFCKRINKDTKSIDTVVFSNDGDVGYIDQSVNSDYGVRYPCYLQSGIISPAGKPDDAFVFKYITSIFVPQATGTFTLSYFINGVFQETLTFNMVSSQRTNPLGDGFTLGIRSRLGGGPLLKLEKQTIHGDGLFYSWYIEYNPSNNTDVSEYFELLGILVDVDGAEKTIGEVVS